MRSETTTSSATAVARVVFGRPRGERGSYMQWREEHIAPQVVFEVLSPRNTLAEMVRNLRFYEQYGVEGFYLYDPEHSALDGWLRTGDRLLPIESAEGWVSPHLGIRFAMEQGSLVIYCSDGRRFDIYVKLEHQWEHDHQRAASCSARLRALGIDPTELDTPAG